MKHFSERENKIIKIIGRKEVTLRFITTKLFKVIGVLDPDIAVANSITRIIKKCDHHNLDWTLEKTRANNKLTIKRSKV